MKCCAEVEEECGHPMYIARATWDVPMEITVLRHDTEQCKLRSVSSAWTTREKCLRVWHVRGAVHCLQFQPLTMESLFPASETLATSFSIHKSSLMFFTLWWRQPCGWPSPICRRRPRWTPRITSPLVYPYWTLANLLAGRNSRVGHLIISLSQVTDRSDSVRVLLSCFHGAGSNLCVWSHFPIILIPSPLFPRSGVGLVLTRDLVKTSAGIFVRSDGFGAITCTFCSVRTAGGMSFFCSV